MTVVEDLVQILRICWISGQRNPITFPAIVKVDSRWRRPVFSSQPARLKYCTAFSCCLAFARVLNVPRFLRLPVFGFILRE